MLLFPTRLNSIVKVSGLVKGILMWNSSPSKNIIIYKYIRYTRKHFGHRILGCWSLFRDDCFLRVVTTNGVTLFIFHCEIHEGTIFLLESLLLFAPQSVVFYQPIKLECKGQSGSLTQIKWFKNNVPLTVNTNVLSLNGQSYEDQGYYRCTAKSSGLLLTSREVLVQFKGIFSHVGYRIRRLAL